MEGDRLMNLDRRNKGGSGSKRNEVELSKRLTGGMQKYTHPRKAKVAGSGLCKYLKN